MDLKFQSMYSKHEPILPFGLPGGSDSEESACRSGDPGSTPGLVRSPGEGHGSPLQCSYLENSVKRGAWRTTAMGSQIVRQN